MPLYGASPRRIRSTWSTASLIVRMTMSTVTAKAGNRLASYPGGTPGSPVFVAMTFTLAESFGHVNPNMHEVG